MAAVAAFTAAFCLSTVLSQAALPANPLVEFRFPEGVDVVTTNTGTLAENAYFNITDNPAYPGFSTNVPMGAYVPADNGFSVDMGPFVGNVTAM
jgi:hypothetical protein